MKKLIVLAAVAMTAALTQAAYVTWSANGILGSDGNALNSGAAYVFCTKGSSATTVAAVTAALAGLTTEDALKSYLQSNSLMALKSTVASGSAGVSSVDLATSGVPEKQSGTTLFAVIVDDDTFAAGTKYVITGASSAVKTPAASTTNTAIFSIPNTATQTTSNWKTASVPEPTSGILMLVGLGALALRRRRA